MKLKFQGGIELLRKRVQACKIRGEWRYIEKNDFYQFKAETANLNWWPSTGTVAFQGGEKSKLATRFARQVAPAAKARLPINLHLNLRSTLRGRRPGRVGVRANTPSKAFQISAERRTQKIASGKI